MKQVLTIIVLSFICCASALGQFGKKDKVKEFEKASKRIKTSQGKTLLQVIQYNKNNAPDSSINTLLLDLPPAKADTSANANKAIKEEIKSFFKRNNVKCPAPQRRISKYVWMCGNGVKIRTNDSRVAELIDNLDQDKEK
jgi:hypothetical protein